MDETALEGRNRGLDAKRKRTRRNDLLLVAGLLLVGLALTLALFAARKDGQEVVVRVDGEVVARLPLSQEQEFPIEIDGRVANRLQIADGAARMTEADCPDKLCVRRGAVRYAGDSIVCLPHRVVVEITGTDELGLDAVAG